MSRTYKLGEVEETLRPLSSEDFSVDQAQKLAKAVVCQSIAIMMGLKEDKKVFSRQTEMNFWRNVKKDNLWFQLLCESGYGMGDVDQMAHRVMTADPEEIRFKFQGQRIIRRRKT